MLKRLSLLLVILLFGCGEKAGPEIVVSFPSTAGFSDSNSADLVMIAESLPSASGILDLDGNGQPDVFAYPTSCSVALSPGCGVTVSASGTFALGNLPLNYGYLLIARIRDSTGATLYEGSTTFTNNGANQDLTILLAASGS